MDEEEAMSSIWRRVAVGLAVVGAVGGGLAAGTSPAAASAAPLASNSFVGFGASLHRGGALVQARGDAFAQAAAAGFASSDCVITFEDVVLDPQQDVPHNWIAEVDLLCS
jgi:hypothetical protein